MICCISGLWWKMIVNSISLLPLFKLVLKTGVRFSFKENLQVLMMQYASGKVIVAVSLRSATIWDFTFQCCWKLCHSAPFNPRSSSIELFTSNLLNSCSETIKADRLYRSTNTPWDKNLSDHCSWKHILFQCAPYFNLISKGLNLLEYLSSSSRPGIWMEAQCRGKAFCRQSGTSGILMHPGTEDAHR